MTSPPQPKPAPEMPAVYSAFAPVFERLSDPLQQALRGQLEQFEPLIEALGLMDEATLGEFEGLGGLTHRGDIAHILQSELLLRTEAPLEFLRRLAESETLFHEKLYADPGARSVYRVMVSVGPGGLGHGRIVALAALFFVARVAQARRAAFHWCFLPRAEGPACIEGLTFNGVKRLLRSASHREMSEDDVADAADAFAGHAPDLAPSEDHRLVDWIVGARSLRGGARKAIAPRAIEASENTLSYALSPPSPGAARLAEVQLRRRGGDLARVLVGFPDDGVCVSALRTPFRPATPALVASASSAKPRPRPGWEPQYFAITHADAAIVRLRDGLLMLSLRDQSATQRAAFVAIEPGVQLAGVAWRGQELSLLTHVNVASGGAFSYGRFYLDQHGQARLQEKWRIESYSAHLFRKQDPYSIPSLQIGRPTTFHSTGGQAYQLAPERSAGALRFSPMHSAPRLLCWTGVHQIVRAEGRTGAELRVQKPGGGQCVTFSEGDDPIARDGLFGLVYSHAEQSLAYSTRPNVWTIPPRRSQPGTAAARAAADLPATERVTLRPSETMVAARLDPRGVTARIWSDARYGGDGTVRIERLAHGRTISSRTVAAFGVDAMRILRVDAGHGGLWAIVADGTGEPAELRYHRAKTKAGKPAVSVIDLNAARGLAAELNLDQIHD